MKNTAEIRKMIASVEDTHRESGQQLGTPSRKCVVAAVISNPLAGQPANQATNHPTKFVCANDLGWFFKAAEQWMWIFVNDPF